MRLLVDTNRKSHIGIPTIPLALTLSDTECQIQGHSEDVRVIKETSSYVTINL